MKLLRFEKFGKTKPGIIDKNNHIRDVSDIVSDWVPKTLNEDIINKIRCAREDSLPLVENNVRVAPCVGQVGKIICVGLNYYDHVLEVGLNIPSEPVIFMKATSAINGPNDNITIPKNSTKT